VALLVTSTSCLHIVKKHAEKMWSVHLVFFKQGERYCMGRLGYGTKDISIQSCEHLHNMIIEDERDVALPTISTSEWPGPVNPAISQHRDVPEIAQFMDAYNYIQDKETCLQLKSDLIDHTWNLYGTRTGPFAPH
jgi:hypothetical protein